MQRNGEPALHELGRSRNGARDETLHVRRAAPGTEINKTIGRYMLHDTYANSHALNAHLASGGREFLVRYRGETWRIELRYAR